MNAAYDNPSSELDHAAKQALEQMLAVIKVLHGGAPLSTLAQYGYRCSNGVPIVGDDRGDS